MDTKLFKNGAQWFFVEKEQSGLLAFVLFPTVFLESRQKGLSIKTTRISLAFARMRLHIHIGQRIEPPVLPEQFLTPQFMNWASSFAKQPLSKGHLEQWVLQHHQWRYIVAWGGDKLHYSKILLIREYLLDLNQPKSNPRSSLSPDDDVDLDISWEDVPTLSISDDDTHLNAAVSQAPKT